MKKIVSGVSAFLLLALVLSCNDNNTSNPSLGYFLVANVSPDAPSLSLTVNSNVIDTGLSFGTFTPYYSANAGTYNFAFYPSGSSTAAVTNNVNIEANKVYSYFLVDSFSEVKSSIVPDVFAKPPGDSVYVRFFNFSPNLPQPISLVDSATGNALASPFISRTFNDQAVSSTYANFTEILAGNFTLQLKLADGTILWSHAGNLEGGKVYTLFAQGTYNGTGAQAFGLGQILNYAP
jgi:hypothetical protein